MFKYSKSLALLTICRKCRLVTAVDDNVKCVKFANSFSGMKWYMSPVPVRSSSNNSKSMRNGPLNINSHHSKQTLEILSKSSVSRKLNTWNKTREGIFILSLSCENFQKILMTAFLVAFSVALFHHTFLLVRGLRLLLCNVFIFSFIFHMVFFITRSILYSKISVLSNCYISSPYFSEITESLESKFKGPFIPSERISHRISHLWNMWQKRTKGFIEVSLLSQLWTQLNTTRRV